MKNSKLLTEYLDECAENLRLIRSGDIADLHELGRRYEADRTGQLWEALLADGWTSEELNAAYARRFPCEVFDGEHTANATDRNDRGAACDCGGRIDRGPTARRDARDAKSLDVYERE